MKTEFTVKEGSVRFKCSPKTFQQRCKYYDVPFRKGKSRQHIYSLTKSMIVIFDNITRGKHNEKTKRKSYIREEQREGHTCIDAIKAHYKTKLICYSSERIEQKDGSVLIKKRLAPLK